MASAGRSSPVATLRIRVSSSEAHELPTHDLQGLCAVSVLQLARLPFAIEPICSTAEPAFDGVIGLSRLIKAHGVSSQATDEQAYLALALSELSALVEHSLFSLPNNYTRVTRPLYSNAMPSPARFVTAGYLRLHAQHRLQHKGLWGLGGEVEKDEAAEWRRKLNPGIDTDLMQHAKEEQAQRKEVIKREFDKLKVALDLASQSRWLYDLQIVELARGILAPIAAKLGSQDFFYGEKCAILDTPLDISYVCRPTTLDAIVFAHLSLLLYLDLPTPVIASLLESSYPGLISHTHRMRDMLFPVSNRASWPAVTASSAREWSFWTRKGGVRRRVENEAKWRAMSWWTWLGVASIPVLGITYHRGDWNLPRLDSFFGEGNLRDEKEEDD